MQTHKFRGESQLKPDEIPKKEPVIRVGMVLPEDEMNEIQLRSNKPFELGIGRELKSLREGPLTVRADNDKVVLQKGDLKIVSDELIFDAMGDEAFFTVAPLIAGRSFHWKKSISVKLNHRLLFKVLNNNLLLINELPLEEYLACVATSEMSPDCPPAFLQAQTIVARSWMLANVEQKHLHLGMDVCNDDCCQRFQGKNALSDQLNKITGDTKGLVLMFQQTICDARYSKSCGGVSERFENLWENTPLPYMQNQVDALHAPTPDLTNEQIFENWVRSMPNTFCSPTLVPEATLGKYLGKVDEEDHYFRWKKSITQEELCENINDKLSLHASAILELKILKRAGSGRILTLRIIYLDKNRNKNQCIVEKDYAIRNVLHPNFLYSSACLIEKKKTDSEFPDFNYTGAGWGHGAGLCQIGALGMAMKGYSVDEILSHYYPGCELTRIYN